MHIKQTYKYCYIQLRHIHQFAVCIEALWKSELEDYIIRRLQKNTTVKLQSTKLSQKLSNDLHMAVLETFVFTWFSVSSFLDFNVPSTA